MFKNCIKYIGNNVSLHLRENRPYVHICDLEKSFDNHLIDYRILDST